MKSRWTGARLWPPRETAAENLKIASMGDKRGRWQHHVEGANLDIKHGRAEEFSRCLIDVTRSSNLQCAGRLMYYSVDRIDLVASYEMYELACSGGCSY